MSGGDWWNRPLGDLEREIRRLQAVVKNPDKWPRGGLLPTMRRLSSLKAIYAARRGQLPLFPLKKE